MIRLVEDDEVGLTYGVMSQLRTHLTETEYCAAVRRQRAQGYEVAVLLDDGGPQCVAGYRILESLAWGKVIYVDDLVSDGHSRSKFYGKTMLLWLMEEGRRRGCRHLQLDSGVQRHAAHRFYLRERMDIAAYHFELPL